MKRIKMEEYAVREIEQLCTVYRVIVQSTSKCINPDKCNERDMEQPSSGDAPNMQQIRSQSDADKVAEMTLLDRLFSIGPVLAMALAMAWPDAWLHIVVAAFLFHLFGPVFALHHSIIQNGRCKHE